MIKEPFKNHFYRRNLPHFQLKQAVYFVTFRLHGTLPKSLIKALKEELNAIEHQMRSSHDPKLKEQFTILKKRQFACIEQHLDSCTTGPDWLKQPAIAEIVQEAIQYRDKREYDLYAYSIMPNHVHLVFYTDQTFEIKSQGKEISPYWISKIMGNLKWYTALKSNPYLNRKGAFWQEESYDHIVRDEQELNRVINYVLANPVKAGLAKTPKEHPYTYCKFNL